MPERAVGHPPVLALVGPTASGKTAVALSAAERLGAEIVAVDAFTVYRGMDIGTAKPGADDRARVPHHCLDLLDPSEDCTVEWFQGRARAAIDGVLERGSTPLLVGGSGLYFRAVVDPLEFPPTEPDVRARVAHRYAGDARRAHADLAAADPDAAARIDADNFRRTVRALEVLELTGRRFSDWRRAWHDHRSVYPGLRVVGLAVDRAALAERISARTDRLFAAGLVDECLRLAGSRLSATARQAIGYAEVLDHLAGGCTLEQARAQTVVRTRRYAARQQRWFSSDPRVAWVVREKAAEALLRTAGASGDTPRIPNEEARFR